MFCLCFANVFVLLCVAMGLECWMVGLGFGLMCFKVCASEMFGHFPLRNFWLDVGYCVWMCLEPLGASIVGFIVVV